MRLASLRASYFFTRLRQMSFTCTHRDCPWLTEAAVILLDNWLKPGDRGVEWGAGRSTIWFAKRVEYLISVEHNREWYERVLALLAKKALAKNVNLKHIECGLREQDEPPGHPYADCVTEVPEESLDFALVDGRIRLRCMKAVLPRLKRGGLLILDNANRYIPNRFASSHTTMHEPRDAPRSDGWAELIKSLEHWRWLNASDGVWDTRFWVKP